jgi:hypothetical protein
MEHFLSSSECFALQEKQPEEHSRWIHALLEALLRKAEGISDRYIVVVASSSTTIKERLIQQPGREEADNAKRCNNQHLALVE